MKASTRLTGFALACLLLAVAAALVVRPLPETQRNDGSSPAALPAPVEPAAGGDAASTGPAESLREPPLHPLALSLGTSSIPPEREPEIVLQILDGYRRFQGAYPTGEDNAAVMERLTGKVRGGVRMFPPDHRRINAQGALCDAWGTPFFFHHLSSQSLDVRSAGPDREFYTADDLVVPKRPPMPAQP